MFVFKELFSVSAGTLTSNRCSACCINTPCISSACLQSGPHPPACFLIFSLKGSCRSNLLFPETGVKGWGITALPPQCYKSLALEGGRGRGGRGREGEAQGTRDSQVYGSVVKPDTMELCGWGISLQLPARGVYNAHRRRGRRTTRPRRQRGNKAALCYYCDMMTATPLITECRHFCEILHFLPFIASI